MMNDDEKCICGGPITDWDYKSPTYATCGNIRCAEEIDLVNTPSQYELTQGGECVEVEG